MPSLLIAAAASIAVAVATLALPSGPTYDPYSWLIWGRDLAHLDLVTSASGTSWKPLPALVGALLSPLGSAAADGWLVVARAGALFAVFMAFRLAWRLAPRGTGLPAGLVAAASLTLSGQWLRRNGVGDAEGLMTAFGLLAVDRHLDERHGQAFWLIVAAGLIRVEAWPFAAAYGLWLLLRREARWSVPAAGLLTVVLWFGGDWLVTGSLLDAANQARRPIPGAPGAGPHPALAVLQEGFTMLPLSAWAAVVVLLLAGLVSMRRRPVRAGVALAACATAWTAIVAAMATRGYLGLPRFLFMAIALDAVAAGLGASVLVAALPHPQTRRVAALVACAAFAYGAVPNARVLPSDAAAIDKVADMDAGIAEAVQESGGATGVLRCGAPVTTWYGVTALEWDLGAVAGTVHDQPQSPRPVFFSPDHGEWDVSTRGCAKRS